MLLFTRTLFIWGLSYYFHDRRKCGLDHGKTASIISRLVYRVFKPLGSMETEVPKNTKHCLGLPETMSSVLRKSKKVGGAVRTIHTGSK